jgi:serine/threonine protein kinase
MGQGFSSIRFQNSFIHTNGTNDKRDEKKNCRNEHMDSGYSSFSTLLNRPSSPKVGSVSLSPNVSVVEHKKFKKSSHVTYVPVSQIKQTISGTLWKFLEIRSEKKRLVAVKIFKGEKKERSCENTENEKEVLNFLRQDSVNEMDGGVHIIKMLGSVQSSPWSCIILEHVDGMDLMELILKTGENGLGEIGSRKIFRQVVKGMNYLHNRAVCHLDLSPENVMLETDGFNVKIIDFGQAERGTWFSRYERGRKQKIRYRAPEIHALSMVYNGKKADVWSLGILLWTMSTGKFAYDEPSKTDSGFRKLSEGGIGIQSWLKSSGMTNFSKEFFDLLCLILQVDPEKRPEVNDILGHVWVRSF